MPKSQMPGAEMPETPKIERHALYEDIAAILTGTLVVSLSLTLYAKATLVTGGVAGIGLLLGYATGLPFDLLFFGLNVPFYGLALVRMGWRVALRTLVAVGLVALFVRLAPAFIDVAALSPLYGAIMGGVLGGLGLLILFRHRTGLGGLNILALYLQERFGWRAGYVQLAVDGAILLAACAVIPLDRVALSLLGALALNLILAMNHKPGRYGAVS